MDGPHKNDLGQDVGKVRDDAERIEQHGFGPRGSRAAGTRRFTSGQRCPETLDSGTLMI